MAENVLTRRQVYKLIDGERNYQDKLPPSRTDGSAKTVGDYLTMLRAYMNHADEAWIGHAGADKALSVIRKIGGIAVRCMEEHGAPKREDEVKADLKIQKRIKDLFRKARTK